MADNPNVIVSEVAAAPETVKEIRNGMTVAPSGGGVPIDRAPINPQFVELVKAGVYTKRFGGTDRCIRVIEVPQQGGTSDAYHCSRPCIGVGDQRLCPEHNKDFFQPNQTAHGTKPRSFNSASVPLTKSELEIRNDKGEVVGEMQEGRSVARVSSSNSAPSEPVRLPEVAGRNPASPAQGINISLGLEELELSNTEILKILVDRICASLDELPASNIKQMKRVVKIQEKLKGEES